MPQWGRPSGASRRRQEEWGWEHRRRGLEPRRFEELDADDGDGEERTWELDVRRPRQAGDELFFTGGDLGARPPRARRWASPDRSEPEEEEIYSDEADSGDMQLVVQEREQDLVQMAMERIHHARTRGKFNVRLTRSEFEALERERQRLAPTRGPTSQESGVARAERRKHGRPRSEQTSSSHRRGTSEAGSRKSKTTAVYDPESPPYVPGLVSAGIAALEAERSAPYPSVDYLPSPRRKRHSKQGSSSTSSSRPSSRKSSSPPHYNPSPQTRPAFLPETAPSPSRSPAGVSRTSPRSTGLLPYPDQPPRARSRSTVQPTPALDPFQYQIHPPPASPQPSPRYLSTRRGMLVPADVQYSSLARQPPSSPAAAYARPRSRGTSESSDPYISGRWPVDRAAEPEPAPAPLPPPPPLSDEEDFLVDSDLDESSVEVELSRSTGDVGVKESRKGSSGARRRRRG